MSIGEMKEKMNADVAQVRVLLMDARVKLEFAVERVSELEREEMALQSALDILENKVAARPTIITTPGKNVQTFEYAAPPEEVAQIGEEKIIVEAGFKMGTNSFGEPCLVPTDASDYPTMAEPTKPDNKAVILPPVGADEAFGAPEDML